MLRTTNTVFGGWKRCRRRRRADGRRRRARSGRRREGARRGRPARPGGLVRGRPPVCGAVVFRRVGRTPSPVELTFERRVRLLGGVRALAGGILQKLWLPSASVAVLQFRLPGRTALAVLDARLSLAAVADDRPTSTDSAPRSQATLRAALEGARLSSARLERPLHGGEVAARLGFETLAGPRALIAGDGPALLLLGPAESGERIVWAAAGAGTDRRPGAAYREVREVQLGEPASPTSTATATATATEDAALLRAALAAEEA